MTTHFDPDTHTYTVNGKPVQSVTEVVSIATAGKYEALNTGLMRAAQQRGTDIHELCALYDLDALPDEIAPEYAPYIKAWSRFCRDYRPQWIHIEKQLYAPDYAGTVDRIGIIDGVPIVVDIKSTSAMDRASKISLCCQLAGYEMLARINGIYVEFRSGIGVQLKKDGKYTVQECAKIEQKYNFNSVDLFNSMLKIAKVLKG